MNRHPLNLKHVLDIFRLVFIISAVCIFFPGTAWAIQLHAGQEGIITHQVGHLFFLFSMIVLIFTITGKGLNHSKGWRLIQYSAFFFILWNLDTISAHFIDNQIHAIKMENVSLTRITVVTQKGSSLLAWVYYLLKLDHLLCVPAMLFLYKGLSNLVKEQQQAAAKREMP